MEYLHVLSRPKVIDQEHDTVWTEAYIDNTVSSPRHPSPDSLNPAERNQLQLCKQERISTYTNYRALGIGELNN